MTSVMARYTVVRQAAFAVAILSQLQGTVSGPLTLRNPVQAGFRSISGPWMGGLSAVPPPGETPAHQHDWPNPSLASFPSSLRGDTQGGLALLLVPTFPPGQHAGDDQPNPLGYPYPLSLRTIALNLLETTLNGQDARPSGTSWDAQIPPTFPSGLRTWVWSSALQTTLAPQDAPAKLGDQPNPHIAQRAHVGEVSSSPLILLTTPATNYLARLPLFTRFTPRVIPQDFTSQNVLQTTLQPTLDPPPVTVTRAASDQPNPLGYLYPISLRTITEPPSLSLQSSPMPDGRHAGDDQPNPRGHVVPLAARGQASGTPTGLLEEAQPDTVYVTRTPVITRIWPRPHPQFMVRNLLQTTLEGQDERPETAGWANPPPARFPNAGRTWTQNLLQTTLEATPEAIPPGTLAGRDQPNPIRPQFAKIRSFTQSIPKVFVPDPEPPVIGRTSPNPLRMPVRVDLLTWAQNLLQSTLRPDAPDTPVYEVDLEVVRSVHLDLGVQTAVEIDLQATTAVEIDLKVI